MNYNYIITATRQGHTVATPQLSATDALAAISAAESELCLQTRQYHISERSGHIHTVSWTGVEFVARRVN